MKKLLLAISMLSISIASDATPSANSVVDHVAVDVCIRNGWICVHQEGGHLDLLNLSNARQSYDPLRDDDNSRIASCGGWHGSQGKMRSQC